ncbi:sigma-70 family RNA polymerase sigma factor [Bacillus sp. FJAT-52991]|uniref:Sigma-70 family RNA polymerase sigma factor n=1 Tax=Bacillus kandeliae TaxID=3129297 RepID=A0ABZ2N3M6_9BACI
MRTLIFEYKQSLRELKKMKAAIEAEEELSELDQQDKSMINSMISDVEFAIQWMVSGRNPDAMRGADRSDVYLVNQQVLDKIELTLLHDKVDYQEYNDVISSNEVILNALQSLTHREKDCFIMTQCEGLTFEYVGELMGVKKGTVQKNVERAKQKIERELESNLFLCG